jgi:flagellar biosynthetic protein FliR
MTIGLLVIFALNLHHLLILAVVNSYQIFIPGEPILVEDFAFTVARVTTESFKLGIQLAAPFIGLGLVFYSAMGIINRLMPSMQIFFVAIPLQVGMGLALMALSLPVLFGWFIEAFEAQMMQFLVP